jgi:hypothetical protein
VTPVLDLRTTPFSRYGSYVAFSWLPPAGDLPGGVYLRSLRGPLVGANPWQPIFQVELLVDGSPCAPEVEATPTLLRLGDGTGDRYAEVCFEHADRVRLRAHDAGLRLTVCPRGYDYALPRAEERWEVVVCSEVETKFMLGALRGKIVAQTVWSGLRATQLSIELLPEVGTGEWFIDEYTAAWPCLPHAAGFAEALAGSADEFEAWAKGCTDMAPAYTSAAAHAAYVTWSCVVAPAGQLRRPAMYMSKNAMASIWSWDNCFNALALAPHAPALAWDQLLVMLELQDARGVIPDLANDRFVSWSFCKPPVYGWALARLARLPHMLTPERLAEVYAPLCRMTEWWLRERDDNGDGIPQYNHGNESGWDNSTVFSVLPPVDAPDLATYLVLQMEFLAFAAAELGDAAESDRWQARSTRLLRQMLEYFWRGDRFVARDTRTGTEIDCESLLLYIPLLLGRRLPPHVAAPLVARLGQPQRFLTEFGFASESMQSAWYEPDGYWRGPIWGAPMVMLVEALEAVGESKLAAEARRRFCELVAARGLAENYNAGSGEPLRDRAFTWTASAFLLLAAESK